MTGAPLFGIYGVGGHGRETMAAARRSSPVDASAEFVFIDDNPPAESINNHRVLSYQQFLASETTRKFVNVAIVDSRIRERLVERCRQDGLSFFPVVASSVIIGDDVQMGEGCLLSPFVLLTSNIRIGRHFHANMFSYVAHDCVIGEYVTFAPSVRCNGNVVIEDHAYIGTGAVLRQGRPDAPLVIGQGAVVGMGAIVTRSVPAGTTVVGNPARPLKRS